MALLCLLYLSVDNSHYLLIQRHQKQYLTHCSGSDNVSKSLSQSNLPSSRKERSEGIFFIRPGSRLVQQQGRTDVAEVLLEQSLDESECFPDFWISAQVVQHSSLLEHSGNVTALALTGKDTLISGSRDRLNLVADDYDLCDEAWTYHEEPEFLLILGPSIFTSLLGGKSLKSKSGNHICDKVFELQKYRNCQCRPQHWSNH